MVLPQNAMYAVFDDIASANEVEAAYLPLLLQLALSSALSMLPRERPRVDTTTQAGMKRS